MKQFRILILVLCTAIYCYAIKQNNVCKTFGEYPLRDLSDNCWYNPDVKASASDIIIRHGYPVEIYETITEDFYILQIYRIPPKSNHTKGIVFLQHALTAACTEWILLGNRSLAFLLADEGYDVWLGNFRGTYFSNKHVFLSSESNKYWNFSFHEYGFYDLTAQFKLVKTETGQEKFYYIGYSVATTAAFVYSSLRPQHAKEHIKLFICLAPVASPRSVKSASAIIAAPFTNLLMFLAEVFHTMNFIPYNGVLHSLIKSVCGNIPIVCAHLVMQLAGPDWKYVDASVYPVLAYQSFAGSSTKVLGHYGQIYNAKGRFQFFDYGSHKNKYYYHTKQPPLYPIDNIDVPMFFMYGGHDFLATKKDAIDFYNTLPSKVRYGIRNTESYNHVDFVSAKQVVEFVYRPIINLIEGMG